MPVVKYRVHGTGLPRRQTELPVPGWAGEPQPRVDGSHEQIWHCAPFSEGARYGIEILYPFEQELRVRTHRGRVQLEADWGPDPGGGLNWPPFRPFGEGFYSYQIVLDLMVDGAWAVRTEPHPRFYADMTSSVPIAVPALIRTSWWPMMFFAIFKAPPKGATHVFRKGEGFLQVIVIPAEPDLTLEPMGEATPPSASSNRAASTLAATSCRLTPAGCRPPKRFSTALIGTCCARPRRANAAADLAEDWPRPRTSRGPRRRRSACTSRAFHRAKATLQL